MPRQAPLPTGPERSARAWARHRILTRRALAAALAALLLALLSLRLGGPTVGIAAVIATIAGLFLALLLGTGLVGLVLVGRRRESSRVRGSES